MRFAFVYCPGWNPAQAIPDAPPPPDPLRRRYSLGINLNPCPIEDNSEPHAQLMTNGRQAPYIAMQGVTTVTERNRYARQHLRCPVHPTAHIETFFNQYTANQRYHSRLPDVFERTWIPPEAGHDYHLTGVNMWVPRVRTLHTGW